MLTVNFWQRRQSRRPFFILLLIIVTVVLFASPFGNTPESVAENKTAGARRYETSESPTRNTSLERVRLEQHEYLKNGLLKINKRGPHPIYELVRAAQDAWNKKLRSASRTLEEAVVEYRRRYKREPPRGFDDWYVLFRDAELCS
jgi:Ni/Co efflux regulator RcnB